MLEAEQALANIREAVANITDMTTSIAAATEEQMDTAEEISRNIAAIAQSADQTSEEAYQCPSGQVIYMKALKGQNCRVTG